MNSCSRENLLNLSPLAAAFAGPQPQTSCQASTFNDASAVRWHCAKPLHDRQRLTERCAVVWDIRPELSAYRGPTPLATKRKPRAAAP